MIGMQMSAISFLAEELAERIRRMLRAIFNSYGVSFSTF